MAPAVVLQVFCQFVMIALARRGVAPWRRKSIYLALAAAALLAASCSLLVEDTRAFSGAAAVLGGRLAGHGVGPGAEFRDSGRRATQMRTAPLRYAAYAEGFCARDVLIAWPSTWAAKTGLRRGPFQKEAYSSVPYWHGSARRPNVARRACTPVAAPRIHHRIAGALWSFRCRALVRRSLWPPDRHEDDKPRSPIITRS